MRVTVRQIRNVETRRVMLVKVMKLRSGKTLLLVTYHTVLNEDENHGTQNQ